jgi:hypothetical protein
MASLALAACGGGGGDKADTPPVAELSAYSLPPPNDDVSATLAVPASQAGTFCVPNQGAEVFGGLAYVTKFPIRQKAYGCLVVSSAKGHPVLTGTQSIRFEVGPNDCSASVDYDDCLNNTSRHQIDESDATPTAGKVLTYETNVFIPPQTRLRPPGCCNVTTLAEVTSFGVNGFSVLAWLTVTESGDLAMRLHSGFKYEYLKDVPLAANPVGRWVNIRYEIKSTTQADGYLKVYVDGLLKVDQTRATLPIATVNNRLTLGIMNLGKSSATAPYGSQVFYVDGLSKTVR